MTASDIRAGRVVLESRNRQWECAEDQKNAVHVTATKLMFSVGLTFLKVPYYVKFPLQGVFYNNKSASSLSVKSSGISPSFTSPGHSTHTESVLKHAVLEIGPL